MTLRFLTRLGLAASLGFCLSVPAQAQDTRAMFVDAKERAEAGSLTRAMEMFQNIVDLDPSLPDAAWNVGYLAARLSNWGTCSLYYRHYIYRTPDAADVGEARNQIERCESRSAGAGTISLITASQRDAEISINGIAVGEGRVQDIVLPAGTYTIRVTKKDYDTYTEEVEITPRGSVEVRAPMRETIYYGRVKVRVAQAGAAILVDGREVGVSPIPEDGLSEVSRSDVLLTVELDGYHKWQRYLDIPRDGVIDLDIRLIPLDR